MTKILGCDISITGPAITCYDTITGKTRISAVTTKKKFTGQWKIPDKDIVINSALYPPWVNPQQRYHQVADTLLSHLDISPTDDIRCFIEGASFGSKGQLHQISQNAQVIKSILYIIYGVREFIEMPPSTIKKQTTGKGNATKEEMHCLLTEKYGINISEILRQQPHGNPVSDIVDSYCIMQIGLKKENEND